MITTFQFLDIT